MKNKNVAFWVAMLFFCIPVLQAQTPFVKLYSADSLAVVPKQLHPLQFNVGLGTAYMNSGFMSGSFTNVTPQISYQATSRLYIVASSTFLFNNMGYNSNARLGNFSAAPMYGNNMFLRADASYAMSSKLNVTGSVFKSFQPAHTPVANPFALDISGINMGLNYKITENIRVGAQIEYSNRYQNMLYNALQPGFFNAENSFFGY